MIVFEPSEIGWTFFEMYLPKIEFTSKEGMSEKVFIYFKNLSSLASDR